MLSQSRLASNRAREGDLEEQITRLHTKTAQLPVFECDAMLREEILDIKFDIDKAEKDISAFLAYTYTYIYSIYALLLESSLMMRRRSVRAVPETAAGLLRVSVAGLRGTLHQLRGRSGSLARFYVCVGINEFALISHSYIYIHTVHTYIPYIHIHSSCCRCPSRTTISCGPC